MHSFIQLLLCVSVCIIHTTYTMQEASIQLTQQNHNALTEILTSSPSIDKALNQMRALAKKDNEWEHILADKQCTATIISITDKWYKHDVYNRPEFSAVYLGTPSSVEWCKEYVQYKPNAQDRLKEILITIADDKKPNLRLATAILDVMKSFEKLPINSPALICATKNEHLAYITLLLNRNIDIESKDVGNEDTALMVAALHKQTIIFDFLIEQKANVNASNRWGQNVLELATQKGNRIMVQKLLAAGAIDVDNKALEKAHYYFSVENKVIYHRMIQLLEKKQQIKNT